MLGMREYKHSIKQVGKKKVCARREVHPPPWQRIVQPRSTIPGQAPTSPPIILRHACEGKLGPVLRRTSCSPRNSYVQEILHGLYNNRIGFIDRFNVVKHLFLGQA
jgi:hypothetical protein